VFNVESGNLFERVPAGMRGMQINLVATVGREIDPAEFGPQPVNVHMRASLFHSEFCKRGAYAA